MLNIVRSFDQISQKILNAVVILNRNSVPLNAFGAFLSSDQILQFSTIVREQTTRTFATNTGLWHKLDIPFSVLKREAH